MGLNIIPILDVIDSLSSIYIKLEQCPFFVQLFITYLKLLQILGYLICSAVLEAVLLCILNIFS